MAGKSSKKNAVPKTTTAISSVDNDDEEEIDTLPVKSSFQAKFAMLMDDDDDAENGNNDDDDDDNQKEETSAPVKTTTASASSKKKPTKKKGQPAKGKKQEDDEIDNLLAQIESTTVSSKKSSSNKKNKQTTKTNDEDFKEGEGQDLEDILKEIDEQFDESNRRKEAKKEKKKKKKDDSKQETETPSQPAVKENVPKEATTVITATVEPTNNAAEGGEDDATASTEKKSTSKNKKKAEEKKKKGGVDAKTLALMKQFQKEQEEAKLKAIEEEEKKNKALEELEKKREEQIRLEKERREKKKAKEKQRIQRKKEDGTYLTKEQREKLERARVQLEAAGIQVPARQNAAKTAGVEEQPSQPTKKRVLYDDRRKKDKTVLKQDSQEDSTNPNASGDSNTVTDDKLAEIAKKKIKDDWDQESEEEASTVAEDAAVSSQTTGTTTSTTEKTTTSEKAPATSRSINVMKLPEEKHYSSDSDSKDDSSSDESEEVTSSSDEDDEKDEDAKLQPMERVRVQLKRRQQKYEARRSTEVLRAPVVCVLGHVDTGKTKILDNLRRSHVQDGEAGGITQQIGATNVPLDTIRERTKACRKLISREGDFLVPGFLIIDTPGHESFKNLRSRGSSLCDLAILVVDLMHGLEPQTIESIKLLQEKQTPFVVALNKIDRLYNWKSNSKENVQLVLDDQAANTKNEFEKRCNEVIVQFAEQSINVALYYKNPDPNEFISLIPTSAHSGDGMGSLIAMLVEKCQTTLARRLSYTDALEATVMEVKAIGGLGTTIDVILVNGRLRVGDTIVVGGQEGPIVTQVRGLLMPEPNKELRVRNQYLNYKEVKAARGIKIAAKELEKALAGLPLFVARNEDEIEYFKREIENTLKVALTSIQLKENGVYVQASTLGSLEALLEFLRTSKIPYSGINIGPVHRRDAMRASTQLERDAQWAVILAFDVRIERDAQEYADNVGVKIFQADIIYHLFDMFLAHRERLRKENQEKFRHVAVFPCKLRILPQFIFNSRDPIVCGVIVEDGFVRLGTPICVPSKEFIELGRVSSIESNHKPLEMARKGAEVCIKIESVSGDAPKMFGRHFDENDLLMSKVTRESIDAVKDHFRDDMAKADWQLMIELKKIYSIL